MEIYEPFDVVVVPFPFTDRETRKRRPALVLSSSPFQEQTGHVILAMVTTAKQSAWDSDVPLKHWKSAGLPRASVVRAKVFTLDTRFVLRRLASLSEHDRKSVSNALSGVIPVL
jgi:mRNA interferase MazF